VPVPTRHSRRQALFPAPSAIPGAKRYPGFLLDGAHQAGLNVEQGGGEAGVVDQELVHD